MIITCTECSTRFELDESRIPETGARVRCSRCKHAFFLPNPSTSQSDAVHAIAEQAARDEAVDAPKPSADLPRPEAKAVRSRSKPDSEIDEEDWQFSEEIRVAGDEGAEAEDDFGTSADLEAGFDEAALPRDSLDRAGVEEPQLGTSNGPADPESIAVDAGPVGESGLEIDRGPDTQETGIEAGHDESSFGSIDDFSSLTETDDAGPDSTGTTVGLDVDSPPLGADATSSGPGSPATGSDDLGDPESWDLVPGEDFDVTSRSISGLMSSFGPSHSTGIDFSGFESNFDPTAYEDNAGEVSWLGRSLGQLTRFVGWVFTTIVVAGALYLSLQSEWIQWQPTLQALSVGSMTAETTESGWIETSRAGSLLIVNGLVRNSSRETIWPRDLQIVFFNARHRRIEEPVMMVGEPLPDRILREATLREVEAATLVAHEGFLQTPLGPGEVRAFQAVASAVPKHARRMVLKLAESPQAASPTIPVASEEPRIEDALAGDDAVVEVPATASSESVR